MVRKVLGGLSYVWNTMIKKTRGRPRKSHDNGTVREWLGHYFDVRDFCAKNPRAEDVLVGCARAREARDTGRGLHTWKLFVVLQSLDAITSSGVAEILKCADRTARTYAIAAEIASRALGPLAVDGLQEDAADNEVPDLLAYEDDLEAIGAIDSIALA